jgi:hypothetical protein
MRRPSAESAHAPIFVVGTGRSGTTLLRQMLSAHPRIHLTLEGSFYLWERRRRGALEPYLERYLEGFSFRWMGLDPRPIFAGLSRHSTHRDVYTALMRTAATQRGKVRWGDKTPGHWSRLDRVFRDFPDARVVRIVRDPVEVVRSLRSMPWFPPSLVAGALLVVREEKHCATFGDRLLTIRLEDLAAEPEPVLRRVLDFVDEPWDPAVLDRTAAPDDLPPMPWFQRGAQASPSAPLAPAEVRLVERITEAVRRTHRYPQRALHAEPSRSAVLRSAVRDLRPLVSGGVALTRAMRVLLAPQGSNAPRGFELLGRVNPGAVRRYPGFTWSVPPPLPDDWRPLLTASARPGAKPPGR